MSDDTASPASAQVIAGRYQILGLLGAGGMGAVYKVHDRELDEIVALKMLRREIATSPGIAERFRREVKLARRVTHPSVARTFDLGEHEGERFLTMEYVAGESLATYIAREGALPVATVLGLAAAICAGLEAAHAAGVIHRDLKPDNVLVAGQRIVITDFGIACAQEAQGASRTAIPIGTPAYMAPEQVEASPDIDARADIYALGVMMFELLTGHLPFEADSVFAVAAMRLTQPPPDPRVHRADLPSAVALIVQRCMATRPKDRPSSAREVGTMLAGTTLPEVDPLARTAESHTPENDAASHKNKTVAVLPFRNAGPEADEYLVDGLTDDLIDALSMTPGLRVRPRGVVMQHKQTSLDPRALGRELDVRVVVDGTMRTTPDTIRVSARVLSVDDGFQIWAKRFDGTRADVLRIGDDASRAIAAALTASTPERPAMLTDPVAVDLYLRARHELFKFSAAATARAAELLKDAHTRAPSDPLIMAGYATALARQFTTANAERTIIARQVAEDAVRLAPQLAETHVALACVALQDADPIAVAASVSRALSLSPLLPEAHQLRARLLAEVGSYRDAIEAADTAMQLEPRLAHLRYDVVARARAMLGEWDLADYANYKPDADAANLHWVTAARYTMWQRSPASMARLAEVARGIESESIVLNAFRELVDRKALSPHALAGLEERRSSKRVTKRMRIFWNQISAELRSYVGEPPLDDVRAAVDEGLFDVVWMDGCPLLDTLRSDPVFIALRSVVASRARMVLAELGPLAQ